LERIEAAKFLLGNKDAKEDSYFAFHSSLGGQALVQQKKLFSVDAS